ncbi:metal-dependent carboxypeptidase [Natrialba magadii ATCC 43099]|uniref:Metal-dependent carboxypeptidase n=1 Tax=Natrialba magadii (strain ATCC 43099 / DSM 3394 / CCM 3739 / CIP 104546 / IAM 13178 / JCM 8861 / NBRC 102185 / NCIMB 2190 / MS3) TaxID=547559 RepID=D3STU6_NATMM|nr:carboxypeptidase M32 [Natrialba magadii]ADD05113.1 metal-dependent carboxypeptidase [Natrialba magadii ATCC 43099]ELY23348.1 carboxypeptidase Taq [Natrialba magadii ATCC 43099]
MSTADDSHDTADAPEAYHDLLERSEKLSNVHMASMALGWDQRVMMPEGGTPARAGQLSTLSGLSHDLLVDDDVGAWLDELESAELTGEQAAVVRELRRQYDRAADIPAELVERVASHQVETQQVWQEAKAEDDFAHFAPNLEELIDLHRERAAAIEPDANPYRVLYEDRLPYLPLESVEGIFDELREGLVPLIEEIKTEGRELPSVFRGHTYDEDDQMALSQEVVDLLGYPEEHGRLDTAPHPFMSGNQFDARITTRFREHDPTDALMATIHEFGHATYQLGLPKGEYGNPLGESLSSGVHESQSRFWENHVGRTKPFWEFFLPTMKEHFPHLEDVTVDEAYAAVNRIYPENLIRVEADELTYHLHIILRCEIDRAFVEGDLDVSEIPRVWNEKMDDYLGVVPETDTDGCLQDTHWSASFAAFQGYTVGSVLAAQLDAAIRDDLDVDGLVREGEFEPIWEWMTEHVHRYGQRYPTEELIEVATGEPLTADYFLDYVEAKYGELYELDGY